MKVLFIVDPQNDFVDNRGTLYVKGAEEAIDQICEILKSGNYERVMVSQDAHQFYHIGHSEFWKELPDPGTVIEVPGDLSKNNFEPVVCDYENRKNVIRNIYEKNSRNIRIWPHHCLEGSWGYCFPERLVKALNEWSAQHLRSYEVYQKGKDPFRESFSLLDEVAPDFSGTTEFHICGFCKDICVYETLKAIIEKGALPYYTNKISILGNCSVALGEDGAELEEKFKKLLEGWHQESGDKDSALIKEGVVGMGNARAHVEEGAPAAMEEAAPQLFQRAVRAENVGVAHVEQPFNEGDDREMFEGDGARQAPGIGGVAG